MPEINWFAAAAVVPDRPLYARGAGIICGEGQKPVAGEALLELYQVVERGIRRSDYVPAPVIPPVLSQTSIACRAGHELPETGRLLRRARERVKGTLNNRYEGQLRWQATLVDSIKDMVEIGPAPLQYPRDIVGAPGEAL